MEQPPPDVVADDLVALRRRHQAALLRTAARHVGNHALAEEVVQDTWSGAVAGLHRFEGRSSLKTWVFRILENVARTTARREARTVPLSSLGGDPAGGTAPAEDRPGRGAPRPWDAPRDEAPESQLLLDELRRLLARSIESLPPREQAVLTLRALHGRSPEEVCQLLRISDANQRVTLHRARSRLLASVGAYLEGRG